MYRSNTIYIHQNLICIWCRVETRASWAAVGVGNETRGVMRDGLSFHFYFDETEGGFL